MFVRLKGGRAKKREMKKMRKSHPFGRTVNVFYLCIQSGRQLFWGKTPIFVFISKTYFLVLILFRAIQLFFSDCFVQSCGWVKVFFLLDGDESLEEVLLAWEGIKRHVLLVTGMQCLNL